MVSCFVAVRSAVDLSKVKLNSFLILYRKQLRAMGFTDDRLEEAIDTAKRILEKFKLGDEASANSLDLNAATRLITGH